MGTPDLTPFDDLYRQAKGAPCDCGDPSCPVPVWLPEDISLESSEPDGVVGIVWLDGYRVHTWSLGREDGAFEYPWMRKTKLSAEYIAAAKGRK